MFVFYRKYAIEHISDHSGQCNKTCTVISSPLYHRLNAYRLLHHAIARVSRQEYCLTRTPFAELVWGVLNRVSRSIKYLPKGAGAALPASRTPATSREGHLIYPQLGTACLAVLSVCWERVRLALGSYRNKKLRRRTEA